MSPRSILSIGAVTATLFGLALVTLPARMLAGMGLDAPAAGIVLSRNLGAMLLGIALLNWLSRDFRGAPLRAVLIANVSVQLLELLVNGLDLVGGRLPVAGAGGLALHAALAALYGVGLRAALRATEPAPDARAVPI